MTDNPFSKKTVDLTVGHGTTFTPLPKEETNVVPFNSKNTTLVQTTTAIDKNDIDKLGSDLQNAVGATTTKLISTMTASNFGDLGTSLTQLQMQADKLDPNKQFSGLTGWFHKQFVNVKIYLKTEFQSAEHIFDQLQTDLTNRIAANNVWINNLESIKSENFANYQNLVQLMKKAESWKSMLQNQVSNLPQISADDPDALMRMQDKRDIEDLIKRVSQKMDAFSRLKQMAENDAPRVADQIRTSEDTILTLKNIIDFVIPTLKKEFVFYLHSIENMSDQQIIENSRQMTQKALRSSADASSQASIAAAKNLNAPIVDNPTLQFLRDKILLTMMEVKRIDSEAATSREADAQTMKQSTNAFVKQLTA